MNPYLDELLSQPAKLPTVPEVVRGIMESFGEEDLALDTLSQQISLDPVIAAKLLRLANSAFYRSQRQILSVDECLLLLGMTTVRNVVLGCGLKESFAPLPGLDLRALWRHSVQTACIARWLARALGRNAELAFTVGLMQSIGQLLIHKAMPERAAQISALVALQAPGRAAIEQRALHFHYGDVSAALARSWNLPDSLASTLADVPMPLRSDAVNLVAACVHMASWCAWRGGHDAAAEPAMSSAGDTGYPVAVADALGLSWCWWPASLDDVAPAGLPVGRRGRLPELDEVTAGLEELLY